LNYWIKVVQDSKVEKHKEIIIFLKLEHGFTYYFTSFVALESQKADAAFIENENLLAM
jgi:hypothetical protein